MDKIKYIAKILIIPKIMTLPEHVISPSDCLYKRPIPLVGKTLCRDLANKGPLMRDCRRTGFAYPRDLRRLLLVGCAGISLVSLRAEAAGTLPSGGHFVAGSGGIAAIHSAWRL